MKMNFKFAGLMLLLVLVLAPAITAADYAEISTVKVDGDVANNGDTLYVERGQELTVRVTVKAATGDLNEAYLGAFISGYRYAYYEPDLVSDFSKTFSLSQGEQRSLDLKLKVPTDIDTKNVKLRIILFDENSASVITYNYQLSIGGAEDENAVEIRDFFVSPSTTISAGSALSFKVKVKNYGDYDIDDLKVKVAIPELDLQTYETIDTIEKDETQSFEALLLRIPSDVEPGDYEVVATVEFDKHQEVEESLNIKVVAPKGTASTGNTEESTKTVITMPASVDVMTGTQGSVYPILVENKGTAPKTYVLSVSGVSDWGTAVFEPSSVFVLKAGQSQTVYLRLTALKNAEAGDKVLKVTVTAGDEMKDTTVIASIKESTTKTNSSVNMKNVLEWFVVVLVVILVILGLILAYKKLRKGNDEEEEQSYY